MSSILGIIVVALSLLFLVVVVVNVARGRLLLRYSLLWIILAMLSLIVAVFPGIADALAQFLSFGETVNFVFFVVIFFLLLSYFSLTIVLSRSANKNVQLVQKIALLEKKLDDLIEKNQNRG